LRKLIVVGLLVAGLVDALIARTMDQQVIVNVVELQLQVAAAGLLVAGLVDARTAKMMEPQVTVLAVDQAQLHRQVHQLHVLLRIHHQHAGRQSIAMAH